MHITATSTAALELEGVTFRRQDKEILHGISFTVERGEHWVMLGPNGAGKSTILAFCGAVTFPTSGTVRVLGNQLGRVELQALRWHHRARQPAPPPPVAANHHRHRAHRHHRNDRNSYALAPHSR